METPSSVDALSLVLSRLELENSVAGAFDARGEYSVEIGAYVGLKIHLALRGSLWVTIDGDRPVRLREGDCVLLTDGKNARFSTKPRARETVHRDSLAARAVDGVMTLGGGGSYFGIGLHFTFGGPFPALLFAHLPSAILVPSGHDQAAALRTNVENFRVEYGGRASGRALVLNHLAPIILLQILRSLESSTLNRRGGRWTLTNPGLANAVAAIHARPAENWSVAALARIARMSRSSFSAKFRRQIGLTPIEYLTQRRMQLAANLLAGGDLGLAEIAGRVGYASESAFSAAFKKTRGCRPGRYARSTAEV